MAKQFSVHRLAMLGMMSALIFAGNFARITMPIAIGGRTSFTLANIFCCMSGLLLGPAGGLASGLGSALYDLTNPLFSAECWITFLTKGAMGLCAGLAVQHTLRQNGLTYSRAVVGSICGCVVYYLLYFLKSFLYDGLLLGGLTPAVAAAVLPAKVPASVFNAVVAILAAPPLTITVRSALKAGDIGQM